MAHTKAPWRYEAGTKTIRAVPSNHWLATMDSWDGAVDHQANALLIAAAPELLSALGALLEKLSAKLPALQYHDCKTEYEMARAAIACATGGNHGK